MTGLYLLLSAPCSWSSLRVLGCPHWMLSASAHTEYRPQLLLGKPLPDAFPVGLSLRLLPLLPSVVGAENSQLQPVNSSLGCTGQGPGRAGPGRVLAVRGSLPLRGSCHFAPAGASTCTDRATLPRGPALPSGGPLIGARPCQSPGRRAGPSAAARLSQPGRGGGCRCGQAGTPSAGQLLLGPERSGEGKHGAPGLAGVAPDVSLPEV